MPILDTTTGLGLPLPNGENRLEIDIFQIRAAFQQIDDLIVALQAVGATKDQLAGLSEALQAAKSALQAADAQLQQLVDTKAAAADLDALQSAADALAAGKVHSVNGLTGIDITVLPEHLGLGPANGADSASITYDNATGRVKSITEQVGGYPATTTISYGPDGSVAQTQVLYRGRLRTENYGTDGAGRIASISATEVNV